MLKLVEYKVIQFILMLLIVLPRILVIHDLTREAQCLLQEALIGGNIKPITLTDNKWKLQQ